MTITIMHTSPAHTRARTRTRTEILTRSAHTARELFRNFHKLKFSNEIY